MRNENSFAKYNPDSDAIVTELKCSGTYKITLLSPVII